MTTYKFSLIEKAIKCTDELFRYQEDDEHVLGFKCFKSFAEAKLYYLECLDEKVTKALKLKMKDVK